MYLSQFSIQRLSFCLLAFSFSSRVIGNTIHVPADYATIQQAINASVNGDTIIVLPGTYYENINFNGKNIILTSTNPEDTNVVSATIIDGHQSGSVVTFAGSETSACQLKGFTVTNGYAYPYPNNRGGGINGNYTQAMIANCYITGNEAGYGFGGGLYRCNGTIVSCTINGNKASNGGGIDKCHGTITNCTIAGNYSGNGGGVSFSDGLITNCTIAGNTASYLGGGLYDCGAAIINCTIVGNTADENGGGLARCDGLVTNLIIWGNNAEGLNDQLQSSSTPTYSCIQDWTGGGVGNISSNPQFVDTSSDNPIDWDTHLLDGSDCIDTGTNSPPGGLPATDIEGNPRPFDGNDDNNPVADMGAYEFHYNPNEPYLFITPKSFSFFAFEPDDNLTTQTMFIDSYGNHILDWSIDLTNKPDWLTITPTFGSLDFNEIQNVIISVDIDGLADGLYSCVFEVVGSEAQNSPQKIAVNLRVGAIYVPADYASIQQAINASLNGDTIIVSPGTYYENINFNEKNIFLTSTNPNDPNVVASTIIDGRQNGSVVTFGGSETSACQLKGFTITNGFNDFGGGIHGNGTQAEIRNCIIIGNIAFVPQSGNYYGNGGGLYDCDGTISNCTVTDNWAFEYGGGLYDCDGVINHCIITSNEISEYCGGGLAYCDGSIINCVVFDNASTYGGGGLAYCNGTISSCMITENMAKDGGGLYRCDASIKNCIIHNNDASGYQNMNVELSGLGGGLFECNGLIANCIIVSNMARSRIGSYSPAAGGGFYNCDSIIYNCIIWGNIANGQRDQLYDSSTPTYSCIQDWAGGGEGNIPSDPNITIAPLFADAGNGDYHLKSQYGRWDTSNHQWVYDTVTSPCIDAGNPNDLGWQNELWPHGGRINMGAYGGTPQASMSGNPVGNIADLNHDNQVSLIDLGLFCEDWLVTENLMDTDLNRSGTVDIADFAVFANQWLLEEEPILSLSQTLFLPVAFTGQGNPDPKTLTVSNLGTGILNWEIDVTGKPDWLTMAPTSGSLDSNESESITLSVDIAGLADGLYSYSFDVLDPATQNSRQTISLHLFMTDIIGDIFYVPVDFPTIQEAINAVATGNTIVVLPGTYTENIILKNGTVLVGGRAATFIDGNQAGSVIMAAGCGESTVLNGFTIMNGNAIRGGGIFLDHSGLTVKNCIFTNNSADSGGGGISFWGDPGSVDPRVTNCLFINNSASSGGGIDASNSAPILTNCTFSGNVATYWGGAINDETGVTIQSCILWNNFTLLHPEANELIGSLCTPKVYHSDIAGCYNENGQWLLSPALDGGGNIDDDPLFVDPNKTDFHLQSLSPCIDAGTNTPLGGLPATDLAGVARIYDGDNDGSAVVDMGAYEVVDSNDACLYVTPNSLTFFSVGNGGNPAGQNIIIQNVGVQTLDWLIDINSLPDWLTVTLTSGSLEFGDSNEVTLAVDANGLSGGQYLYEMQVDGGGAQNSPQTVTVTLSVGSKIYLNGAYYPTIQAAIDASSNGQLVLVGDGIFAGDGNRDIEFKGKAITLRSENGPEHCIIDCQATELDQHRGFYIHEGETASSVIDGFTIKNGVIMNTGGNSYGAAIFCQFTSPTIKNCIITQCTSWLSVIYCTNYFQPSVGAKFINCTIKDNITAIGISDSSPVISDCVIINNDLDGEAGIDCSHSAPTINNCIIAGNYGGSGIICGNDSCPIITNCKIIGNSGHQGAGLLFIDCTSSCQPQIINSLIAGNTAAGRGGGIGTANSNYTISILNCTIIGNFSGEYGGGIYRSGNSSFEVKNSILWGNTAGISGDQLYTGIMPTYSCIQGWTGGGTGNISSDPLFTDTSSGDPADWDLHLLPASPCIDTGTNTPGGLPTTDIEGNPRIIDGDSNGSAIVDMGIYEYVP